jgi:dihydroorotase
LVVAPGFIDLHQHGQTEKAYALKVRDGVTSALELEVGTSDVDAWYAERDDGQLINHGVSVGHIPVRMAVMGDQGSFLPSGPGAHQAANEQQIGEMVDLIEKGLEQGALSVGFGTAYTPGASEEEIERLFRVAADQGASVHVHASSSLEGSVDGLIETVEMAKRSGVSLHVVHANSTGGVVTEQFLTIIEQARKDGLDVTTEAYPYEASMSYIESARYAGWETWPDEKFSDFQWPDTGERLTRQTFAGYREVGGLVVEHKRTEKMTRTAIANPITMIASDGAVNHPRGSGTYARVLGKYVRDDGVLTLMDALRRMTIEPSRRLEYRVPAMRKKGRIRSGADADITVFDPETVIDKATYTDPLVPSHGIVYVLVNGVVVVEDGAIVPQVRPGTAIRVDAE